MKQVITVTGQKGGIGKSTTAHALGAAYARDGAKVLYIDLDPQANLTIATRADRTRQSIYDLLLKPAATAAEIRSVIQTIPTAPGGNTEPIGNGGSLHIIPAAPQLTRIHSTLTETGKEYRLRELISGIRDEYDKIIIDTPPALSILTVNALTACGSVIIPSQADLFSLEALQELKGTLDAVKTYTNKDLKVEGILLTRYQARSILTQELTELIEQAAGNLGTKVFKTKIREAIAIKEAQALKQDIFTYAPNSNVAKDYLKFYREATQNEGKGKK